MPQTINKGTPSTQNYLRIAEIKDDCVTMKDGTLRAIVLVSSINFALKSEDEQNAIFMGYVSFLNSLEAPIQVVIQSRRLDLDGYLAEIEKQEKIQTNDLLKLQTAEYRQFISQMVELGDIMTKRFYLIIPYDPASNKKRSFFQKATDVFSPTKVLKLNQKQFADRRRELLLLVEKMTSGLMSMGLRASVLDTQSLIEFYYNTYNPIVSRQQKMVEVDKLNLENNV